jgi:hypothetical protein
MSAEVKLWLRLSASHGKLILVPIEESRFLGKFGGFWGTAGS